MANTPSICENVLKEFKKTNPTITNIFTKSDNAGSYHGSCIFEGLFKVCKHAGFRLMRTDYNEPCRGKDQCDQESAAAKSIINSFVDAGNDLMTAEDVYKALHYGNGMQDTKVCVLQIDGDNTSLSGKAIRNVSHYHSIKYFEEYVLLWRCFEIGEGVKQVYTNVHFKSSYDIILPFSTTDKKGSGKTITNKLPVGPDRQLCSKLNELDWALPIRSKFRFNYIQKKLLYGHFIEGEKTGKKMSPEQVEKLLRKALNPDQYVTVQQIKSLYSRWAKLLKDGQLEEPKEKENIDTDEIDQEMDNNDDEDTDEESYAKAIQEQVILFVIFLC